MTVEIISQSNSVKVWDRARIEPATPGFAVGLTTDRARGQVDSVCSASSLHVFKDYFLVLLLIYLPY